MNMKKPSTPFPDPVPEFNGEFGDETRITFVPGSPAQAKRIDDAVENEEDSGDMDRTVIGASKPDIPVRESRSEIDKTQIVTKSDTKESAINEVFGASTVVLGRPDRLSTHTDPEMIPPPLVPAPPAKNAAESVSEITSVGVNSASHPGKIVDAAKPKAPQTAKPAPTTSSPPKAPSQIPSKAVSVSVKSSVPQTLLNENTQIGAKAQDKSENTAKVPAPPGKVVSQGAKAPEKTTEKVREQTKTSTKTAIENTPSLEEPELALGMDEHTDSESHPSRVAKSLGVARALFMKAPKPSFHWMRTKNGMLGLVAFAVVVFFLTHRGSESTEIAGRLHKTEVASRALQPSKADQAASPSAGTGETSNQKSGGRADAVLSQFDSAFAKTQGER